MTATASAPSTPATSRGLQILGWGLLVGIAGDALLRGSDGPGLNIAILVGLLSLAAAGLSRHSSLALPDRWLLTALGLSLCFVWRDSELLRALDLLALVAALSLTAMGSRVAARRGHLFDYFATAARSAGFAAAGSVFVLADDGVRERTSRAGLPRVGPVLLGLLVAVPVVLIFASLFAEADPVFEAFIDSLYSWDLGPLFAHGATILALGWISAGTLRGWLSKPEFVKLPAVDLTINPVTIGVVVGSMTAIFLLFVASQSRQLFGGAALIESIAGLTYAEHARRGFFQLVAAAGLAVPVLLVADVALAAAGAKAIGNFRTLASLQLMLIALVMASAFHRVALYISMYGLTVDRLAGMAVLVWLAGVIGWFAVTVLRGRRERFTFGAVVSGFAVLGALNAVNPEAVIARVNTRPAAGREVDYKYLLTLSGDAVPELSRWLRTRPAAERCLAGSELRRIWMGKTQDWRSWNRGQARAVREVERARESTMAACREHPDLGQPPSRGRA